MKVLVGDIGGTKTLLALYTLEKTKKVLEKKERFVSHEFKGLEEIIRRFLGSEVPQRACFGIAGPIENGECRATNLPWIVRQDAIKKAFKIQEVFLINDLLANAYGLNMLSPKDFFVLNQGVKEKEANQGLISAGTGLGESPIFFYKGELIPSPSEGGHADFSPRNDLEIELFKYLKERFGHVSYERVLSGHGLVNLYQFLIDQNLEKESLKGQILMKTQDVAKTISQLGLSGECPACVRALDWFSSLYGAEAGNFALKVMALGGIYIGGGIAPKIIDVLKKGLFMESFKDKGRFLNLLSQVPVQVILEENTALLGSLYFVSR